MNNIKSKLGTVLQMAVIRMLLKEGKSKEEVITILSDLSKNQSKPNTIDGIRLTNY